MINKFCETCGNKHLPGPCAAEPSEFSLSAAGTQAFLVGSWSGWLRKEKMTEKNGRFELEMHLLPGEYEYKYLVDGVWLHDPSKPTVRTEAGQTNNLLNVYPRSSMLVPNEDGRCRIMSHIVNDNLQISGSWDGWKAPLPMLRRHNPLHKKDECFIDLPLKEGAAYEFVFLLGSHYLFD
jgi:hypothetical protein